MTTKALAGVPAGDKSPRLATLSAGSLGSLKLDAIRETALRAGRLAEALFDAPEADVVAVQGGRIWRGKLAGPMSDDATAARIAMIPEAFWVEDARLNPAWSDHPAVQAEHGVRFCAAAPIKLRNGIHLGSLRVFDEKPRPLDADLFARLQDIAAFVSGECDRLLGGEVRRVRELFDQAPGFMAISRGPEHVPEIVNAAFMALVGDRPILGRSLREAIPEIDGFADLVDEVYRSGEPYVGHSMKLELQRTPGAPPSVVYVDFVLQPLKLSGGGVSGIFFQGHEVPDRAVADALRGSRADLEIAQSTIQAIMDHSHDVICAMDAAGVFVLVSKQAEQMWGYRPDELVGRNYTELLDPNDVAASQAARRRMMAGLPTPNVTTRSLCKDGSLVPVMWSTVWSEANQTMYGVARDMREHLAAEEKLRQGAKMEAIGRLTGGVAHDFNNLLTVIIGSAEALSEGLADRPALKPLADMTLEAAERGAELVSRLLAFSRNQVMTPQVVDCAALMDSLLPMLRRTVGEAIEVQLVCDTPGLHCLADRAQLTSALLNLSINARDAMPDGGRLTVRAACAAGGSDDDEDPTLCDGSGVVWSVSDTGEGMSPETVARALEPFFTTKAVG
ncbi:MAG: PAS domain S-box protein, partial [Phenylobacterium sp.]